MLGDDRRLRPRLPSQLAGAGPTSGDGIDWWRALLIPLTVLAWLAVAVVVGWLLGHLVKTILTLILAGILAFALSPLVKILSRWMSRTAAIAVAYIVGFGILAALISLLVVTVAAQITNLVHALPDYAAHSSTYDEQIVRLLKPFGVTATQVAHARVQSIAYLQSIGTTAAKESLAIVTGVLGTIIDTILVLILSVYLISNGPRISEALKRETPDSQEHYTTNLIGIVNRVIGGYVRGTLTLALLIGLLVGIGMAVLRVPYATLLGVLAFFMEFVPVIGVLVSGGVCVLVVLLTGSGWIGANWIAAVIVLGYFVFVHVIEGDVVGPRIMGGAIGIHPATALIALVAGTELFGFWGALFGAPLAGLIQAVLTAAWHEVRSGDPSAVARAAAKTVADDGTDRRVDSTSAAPSAE